MDKSIIVKDSESECSDEMFDELDLGEVLEIVEKHDTYYDFLRDETLFASGLYDNALSWLKELFNTKKKNVDTTSKSK